jgi:hypothetical protein
VSQIKPEEARFLAIGVPSFAPEQFTKEAVAVLERRGFSVKAMTPQDIIEQADWMKNVIEDAKHDKENDPS